MKKFLFFICFVLFAASSIYAQCDAPTNVQASARWDKVNLTWNSTLQSNDYDDSLSYGGTTETGIGAGTSAFTAVVRFTPDSLTRLSGMYLTHVKFTLYSLNLTYVTVKVWQGGSYTNGTFNPGTLICSTPVDITTLVVGENIARIGVPVLVDNTQEIWIGFETQGSGSSTYPAAATSNLVANYNDLIYFSGTWTTLGPAGVEDNGWIIAGCFSLSTPEITGFNVYRNNTMVNTTPIHDHFYTDTALTAETQYCYTVESVCSSTTSSSSPVCVTTTTPPNCGTPIGTGTGSFSYLPFYCFYNYSYTQQIYTASEMGNQQGTIVAVGFPYMYSSPQSFVNVKVYMANVTKTVFANNSDWVPGNDLTLVYDGPYACDATDTFSTIYFDTPFEWDGSSNVVVAMAYNEGSYYTSDPRFYSHTATAGNTSLYVYQDGSAYNPSNPPSGTLTNNRNNILFCYGPEPDCYKPTHPEISGITDNSATLSWHPHAATETQWDVVCVEHGQNVNNGTIIPVYDTTYIFSGLTDNTTYDVYVRTNCSPEVSDWVMLSFHTECVTHQTIPYVETFNGYGAGGEDTYPFCWTRQTNYTTQFPYVTTNGQLYMYSYSNYYSLAVSQALDLSANAAGTLALSFYIGKSSDEYGRLDVGIMTDPSNINTFRLLKSYYPSDYHAVGTFQQEFITLTESFTSPIYLAFYAPAPIAYTSNYVNIDNVRVDYLPTCSNPMNLTVSNVTGTAATISWDAAQYGSTGYTLEYGPDSSTTTQITTTETEYMLTNLTLGTTYNVMLYSNCASESSDTLTYTFTTSVFEECTQPDTSSNEITSANATTIYTLPLNNYWKYTYTQQIFTPAEVSTTPTLITGLSFEYSYSTPMSSKTNVDIYLAHRTTSTFSGSSDWTPIDQATLVYHGDLNCSQGWNNIDFDTYFSYNGNDNLVVIVDDNSNAYNGSSYVFNGHTMTGNVSMYYNSDSTNPDPTNPPSGSTSSNRCDIKIFKCMQSAPISCPPPMVFVSGVDDQSITVDWASNGTESSWELEYQVGNDTTWISYGTVTSSPVIMTNVTTDVVYNLRLRAVCSATDNSDWSTTSVYVPCQSVTIPYMENFDNSAATAVLPDCWVRKYSYTASPLIVSQQAYSGTKSLYFSCSASNYAYAILPRFEDLVLMDNLQIQFQAYKTSEEDFIEVGIMTDINDLNSFVGLGSFSPASNNAWDLGEVLTNTYTGNGHYVAFRIPKWFANSIYIDDVNIQVIPDCPHVTNIYASNIEANSAVINWTPGGTETAWSYLYGPSGTVDPESDMPMVSYEDTVLITGLTPNTLYDVYIMSNCGSSEGSTWMYYSFRSGCAAMTTVPYTENFDSYSGSSSSDINVLPNCWSRIYNGSSYSGYPTVLGSHPSSSPNSLAFYTYSSSYYSDQYAIMPEIDTALLPINTLQLSFDASAYSTSYMFIVEVGVMTDPTNMSTFVPVDTIQTLSTTYSNFEVYFDNFTGNGQYIAFRVAQPASSSSSYYNYGYIDNVVLNTIPECSPVRGLDVTNIAGSSALVVWEAGHFGSVNGYTLEYTEAGQDNWITASSSITQESYMLSGLDPQTTYNVRVSTNCSSGPSAFTTATFTTRCLAGGDITIGSGTTTNSYLPEYSVYNYSYTQQIYTSAEIGGANTFNGITFYANSVPNPSRTISIYLMHTNVSVASSWLPASNAQLVFTGPVTFQIGANSFNFNTPFQYNGMDNLALIVLDETGSWSSSNSWYVHTAPAGSGASMYTYTDSAPYSTTSAPTTSMNTTANRSNITLLGNCDSTVTCIAPNITISNITDNSATINWVAGYNETAWEMDYKLASDTVWTPVANVVNNSVQLTNLTPNTTYNVRMRSDCGGGDYSIYNAAQFRTECGLVATLPFTENFDSYGTGSAVYPSCWSKLNTYTSDRPYVTTGGYSAPGCLYFYTSMSGTYNLAVLPQFDPAININTLQIEFMYKGYYNTDKLIVGVMTDPTDYSTFTPVDTVDATTSWAEYSVMFNNYQGTGHYIALLNQYESSTAYAYVDNVVVDLIPSCPKPRDLMADNTATSATLSWTETGNATAWDIEYGQTGFALGTGTTVNATTNPFTINGLTTGTTYDFYVRANCGGGDESAWVGPTTTTPGSYITPATGNYTINMCGGVIYDDGGINGDYSANCDVVLVVNPDSAGLFVHLTGTFDMEEGYDYMVIYDGTGTNGNVLFDSDQDATLDVTSTTGPLTITFESDGSVFGSGWEIQVSCVNDSTPPVTCDAPTNLVASNLTKNSVVLDWAQTGTPDNWTINYKKSSVNTWTTVTTTTHPYTITNLDSETGYEAFVTANCGDQTSGESNHVTFTTLVDGIEDIDVNTVIYPNPTTGKVTVSNIQSPINGIEVYDVYGKLLNRVEPNLNEVNLDITHYAAGVYFIRIETGNGVANKRIVKK